MALGPGDRRAARDRPGRALAVDYEKAWRAGADLTLAEIIAG